MSRILIINPILYTSETNQIPEVTSIKDTMIYTLCLGFLKLGHQVTLLAAKDYRPAAQEKYDFPIVWMDTVWHGIFQPRCLPYMPKLRRYMKEHREYDLVISSEVFGTWSYTAARVCPDKTLIWHELAKHNNILHKMPSKIWYHIVAKYLMQKILVIPRSEAAFSFIRQFMPRVSDIPIDHGVNMDKIPSDSQINKKNYFIVVSQFIERKRIDKTILHFEEFIKRGYTDYQLNLVGRGELEGALKKLVKAHHLEERVRFCGQMEHERLLPFVAQAKAMLVSTVKDNSMVSVVESIAAGTPVISTSAPLTSVYIRRENLGIVADDWNADALEKVCRENETYVRNCLAYREKLSNTYCAGQFLTIFEANNAGKDLH